MARAEGQALVTPTPLGYEVRLLDSYPLKPAVMDTEAPKGTPRHGGNVFTIFLTSFCAAIVLAGGFGIVFQAAILAAVARLGVTLWLALWTFTRSWHVERRLKAGLEVDEPKLSIMANFRGS